MPKKPQPLNEQENTTNVLSPDEKKNYRNELFDRIINSGYICYAALLVDYSKKNLFCGQIGEIQRVRIEKKNENSYYLIFTDYTNREKQFAYCFVKKQDLLPLFYSDPNQDKKIETTFEGKTNQKFMTLEQIRDEWQKNDVSDILNRETNKLLPHNKVKTRFKRGELVTIQIDFEFEQEMPTNETFTIQAGQIGIISSSNDLKDDSGAVEVIFCSIPFGKLAREKENKKEDLVSFISNQNSDSFATNFWKKKIHIDKHYLFPLYTEKLEYCENLE